MIVALQTTYQFISGGAAREDGGGRFSSAGAFDSDRRNPAFTLLQAKAYPLTFIQLAQASMLNRADMHENIIATGIRRNESVALTGVEPFYNAGEWGALVRFILLYRFHFDTFSFRGGTPAWVINAGHFRRPQYLRALIAKHQLQLDAALQHIVTNGRIRRNLP